jgi:hypothetical protein
MGLIIIKTDRGIARGVCGRVADDALPCVSVRVQRSRSRSRSPRRRGGGGFS